MFSYEAFIVRTKDCTGYLHTTKSKYGTSISLTSNVVNAQQFITKEEASKTMITYLRGKTKIDASMLEIVLTQFTVEDKKVYSALPETKEFNCLSRGWADTKSITKEILTQALYNDYIVNPKDFTFFVEKRNVPLYEGVPESPRMDVNIVFIKDIVWEV